VADSWYPKDLRKRLLVERYLDWHHLGLRKAVMALILRKFILPRQHKPVPDEAIKEAEKETAAALKVFDSTWLKTSSYLAGDQPSIADVSATCELLQLRLVSWDFTPYPRLNAYLTRMAQLAGFEEVNAVLTKLAARKADTQNPPASPRDQAPAPAPFSKL